MVLEISGEREEELRRRFVSARRAYSVAPPSNRRVVAAHAPSSEAEERGGVRHSGLPAAFGVLRPRLEVAIVPTGEVNKTNDQRVVDFIGGVCARRYGVRVSR